MQVETCQYYLHSVRPRGQHYASLLYSPIPPRRITSRASKTFASSPPGDGGRVPHAGEPEALLKRPGVDPPEGAVALPREDAHVIAAAGLHVPRADTLGTVSPSSTGQSAPLGSSGLPITPSAASTLTWARRAPRAPPLGVEGAGSPPGSDAASPPGPSEFPGGPKCRACGRARGGEGGVDSIVGGREDERGITRISQRALHGWIISLGN